MSLEQGLFFLIVIPLIIHEAIDFLVPGRWEARAEKSVDKEIEYIRSRK